MADLPKSPEADFVIRLDGNVKPWMVPMRSLSRILSAVQRLVDQRDDLEDGGEEEVVEPLESTVQAIRTLQLLKIRAGSANYAVSAINRDATLAILRQTG